MYPLRTLLVYDYVTTKTGSGLQIVRLEEIWSLGDLVENAPLISALYRAARTVNGYVLSGLFWLGCLVKPRA